MLQHPDFPPIPKCFSHLIQSTDGVGESRCIRLASWRSELSQIDSEDDEPEHYPVNSSYMREVCADLDSDDQQENKTFIMRESSQSSDEQKVKVDLDNDNDIDSATDQKNPYSKLHSSLLKLQREMKDLRHLDISLFCQLLSLNEAIQDFKMTVSDRYSETGSEYSLGTASYMGSMSSLNDESDWGEEGTLLNSLHDKQDDSEAGENTDENSHNASSLLKQITDLALRADEDF